MGGIDPAFRNEELFEQSEVLVERQEDKVVIGYVGTK